MCLLQKNMRYLSSLGYSFSSKSVINEVKALRHTNALIHKLIKEV